MKELTDKQKQYRAILLNDKVAEIKIELPDKEFNEIFFHINNNIFWINEFIAGRIDNKKLLGIAIALEVNAEDLKGLLFRKLKIKSKK